MRCRLAKIISTDVKQKITDDNLCLSNAPVKHTQLKLISSKRIEYFNFINSKICRVARFPVLDGRFRLLGFKNYIGLWEKVVRVASNCLQAFPAFPSPPPGYPKTMLTVFGGHVVDLRWKKMLILRG
jgi:hypothetical protein